LQIIADAGFKDIKIWHQDIPEFGILQAQQGGSFVISAIKDGHSTPAAITQHDPYIDNIYPEDAEIDHFLINKPIRISGDRAEKGFMQWQSGKIYKETSFLTRVRCYLQEKLGK